MVLPEQENSLNGARSYEGIHFKRVNFTFFLKKNHFKLIPCKRKKIICEMSHLVLLPQNVVIHNWCILYLEKANSTIGVRPLVDVSV